MTVSLGKLVSLLLACWSRKIGPVEDVEYPAPGREEPSALVTYQQHKDARAAVQQLHGHMLGGVLPTK